MLYFHSWTRMSVNPAAHGLPGGGVGLESPKCLRPGGVRKSMLILQGRFRLQVEDNRKQARLFIDRLKSVILFS